MFTNKSRQAREIPVLNNVSLMETAGEFIHNRILPVIPVAERSGKITKYGNEHLRIVANTKRTTTDTGDHKINWTFDASEQFFIDKHDISTEVTDESAALFPSVADRQQDSQIVLTSLQHRAMEEAMANMLFNTSFMTNNSAVTNGWNEATGTPSADIAGALENLRKNCGHSKPTKVIIGAEAFSALKTNSDVLNYYNGTGKVVGADIVKSYLELLTGGAEILVGDARKITSKEGQSTTKGDIWGDSIAFIYTPSSPSLRMQSIGFRLTPTGQRERFTVFDEKYSELYLKEWEYQDLFTDASCGYLLTDLIQS